MNDQVHVHGDVNPVHKDGGVVIRHVFSAAHDQGTFVLFDTQDRLVASGSSARKLSKWAFANGAVTVKHDYDLKLEEG